MSNPEEEFEVASLGDPKTDEKKKISVIEGDILDLKASFLELDSLNEDLRAVNIKHLQTQLDNVYTSFLTMVLSLLSIGIVFTIIYGFATSVMSKVMVLDNITLFNILTFWIICVSVTILFTIILVNFVLISLSRFILHQDIELKWYEKTYIWYIVLIIILILSLILIQT